MVIQSGANGSVSVSTQYTVATTAVLLEKEHHHKRPVVVIWGHLSKTVLFTLIPTKTNPSPPDKSPLLGLLHQDMYYEAQLHSTMQYTSSPSPSAIFNFFFFFLNNHSKKHKMKRFKRTREWQQKMQTKYLRMTTKSMCSYRAHSLN